MKRFNSFARYKNGPEWAGAIPDHWHIGRLKDYVDVINGYPFDSSQFNPREGIPLVRIRDVLRGTTETYFQGPPVNAVWIDNTDILIGMDGDYNVCWWSSGPALLNQRVAALRSRIHLDQRFLYYCLQFPLKIINDLTYFTTVKHLSSDDIRRISLPLPKISEQHHITTFLDYEIARIDWLIRKQQRLIELLQEKRQAIISHAVTKGLDPDAPMKDSSVEWLGHVPAHWAVAPLRWYAEIQGGLAKGKGYEDVPTVERPYLRVANVQDGHLDLTEVHTITVSAADASRCSLKYGDVLMNEGGDNDKLGRGTMWREEIKDCLHQNHVFAIRPDKRMLPEWLALFTRSNSARSYFYLYSKQSTNLASISSSNLMSCLLPLPPIDEQTAIIDDVSERLKRIDRLTESVDDGLRLLAEHRTALISAAVTGKIDVRDWQPPRSLNEPEEPDAHQLPEAMEERTADRPAEKVG